MADLGRTATELFYNLCLLIPVWGTAGPASQAMAGPLLFVDLTITHMCGNETHVYTYVATLKWRYTLLLESQARGRNFLMLPNGPTNA